MYYMGWSPLDDYDSPNPHALDRLNNWAWKRDGMLNTEEKKSLADAVQECILGKNWWLKAHP